MFKIRSDPKLSNPNPSCDKEFQSDPKNPLRWLDTVFKNSGVQHFDMFKLRIFRIYSADIGFFIYFDNSTFKLY